MTMTMTMIMTITKMTHLPVYDGPIFLKYLGMLHDILLLSLEQFQHLYEQQTPALVSDLQNILTNCDHNEDQCWI